MFDDRGQLLVKRWLVSAREPGNSGSEVDLLVPQEVEMRARQRAELRGLLVMCGVEPPSMIALDALLSECPDVDLAFTALTMVPRPMWVQDLVGPPTLRSRASDERQDAGAAPG